MSTDSDSEFTMKDADARQAALEARITAMRDAVLNLGPRMNRRESRGATVGM